MENSQWIDSLSYTAQNIPTINYPRNKIFLCKLCKIYKSSIELEKTDEKTDENKTPIMLAIEAGNVFFLQRKVD